MKHYKLLATAMSAIILCTGLAGCGQNSTNSSSPTNHTPGTNSTIETNLSTQNIQSSANSSNTSSEPKHVATMVSVSLQLTKGEATPSIRFEVPSGWTKEKEWQGDTSGYAWVNPSDSNQQIQVMSSGNMGAIKNYTTGEWNVTGIFGYGTKGIQWNDVSPDKLTANFINTTGFNPYAKNEQTPYTGYGKAFILKKPNPFSMYVEVWGGQSLADVVLRSVQVQAAT